MDKGGGQNGLRSQVRALVGKREAVLELGSEAELETEAPAFYSASPCIHLLLGLKGLRNMTAASTFWVLSCIFTYVGALLSSFAEGPLQASPGAGG